MTTITKKGATHPRSFENTSAMGFCCVVLLLQVLLPLLFSTWQPHCTRLGFQPVHTPRAPWRQLHIKGGGLFHMYHLRVKKVTIRRCWHVGTLSTGHILAPDLAPSLPTPSAQWRQLPKIKRKGLLHEYDVQISRTTLQSCR